MKIVIGSKNPTKVNAVQLVFPEAGIQAESVTSNVSSQPFSDEETRNGAINRALNAVNLFPNHIGIGLEGGVMYVDGQLFLCNWGALTTRSKRILTASGARILLPMEIREKLENGIELGDIMAMYTNNKNIRTKEGAIGIFTNNMVSRKELFVHIVKLLRGQWEYAQ